MDERILGARILTGQMYSFDREMLGWYENIIYGVKINVLVLYDEYVHVWLAPITTSASAPYWMDILTIFYRFIRLLYRN